MPSRPDLAEIKRALRVSAYFAVRMLWGEYRRSPGACQEGTEGVTAGEFGGLKEVENGTLGPLLRAPRFGTRLVPMAEFNIDNFANLP